MIDQEKFNLREHLESHIPPGGLITGDTFERKSLLSSVGLTSLGESILSSVRLTSPVHF